MFEYLNNTADATDEICEWASAIGGNLWAGSIHMSLCVVNVANPFSNLDFTSLNKI